MPILKLAGARTLIRHIVKSGSVALSRHCRERMAERNVEMVDILNVFNWGTVSQGRVNGNGEEQIYRVDGRDLEGEPLTITVKIMNDQTILCITVF